jgi:hypothetical protein
LGTAARLEQIVDRLVGVVLSLHPTNPGVFEVPTELPVADTLALLDAAEVFDEVLGLPEADPPRDR